MKRGLVVRDRSEIADAEWDGRIDSVQSVMADQGLDFVLVYGDVFRSDDIGYLTNLCIYWNEGVVAVPAHGSPLLLTKLSQRVHSWMRATSTMTDLRSGKTFGELVTGLVARRRHRNPRPRRRRPVARLHRGGNPATAIPGWDLRMLGSLVRDQRAYPFARRNRAPARRCRDPRRGPGGRFGARPVDNRADRLARAGHPRWWLHRRRHPDRPDRRRTPRPAGERGIPARLAARKSTGGNRWGRRRC